MATGKAEVILTVAALRTELVFAPRPRAAVGVGRKARAGLVRALNRWKPEGVVVIGYCGGLRAGLHPGTLILAERVVGPEGTVRVGGSILARAKALVPKAAFGPIVTIETPAEPAKKAVLGIDALGVDLESAHLVRELFRRGIPFVVARIVLDAVWEEIPNRMLILGWALRALRCSRRLGDTAVRLSWALKEGR